MKILRIELENGQELLTVNLPREYSDRKCCDMVRSLGSVNPRFRFIFEYSDHCQLPLPF